MAEDSPRQNDANSSAESDGERGTRTASRSTANDEDEEGATGEARIFLASQNPPPPADESSGEPTALAHYPAAEVRRSGIRVATRPEGDRLISAALSAQNANRSPQPLPLSAQQFMMLQQQQQGPDQAHRPYQRSQEQAPSDANLYRLHLRGLVHRVGVPLGSINERRPVLPTQICLASAVGQINSMRSSRSGSGLQLLVSAPAQGPALGPAPVLPQSRGAGARRRPRDADLWSSGNIPAEEVDAERNDRLRQRLMATMNEVREFLQEEDDEDENGDDDDDDEDEDGDETGAGMT